MNESPKRRRQRSPRAPRAPRAPRPSIAEPALPAAVVAAYRGACDRFRDALRRADHAAADAALEALARAATRAGFAKVTACASVQVVVCEAAGMTTRNPAVGELAAPWTGRLGALYDAALSAL